MKLINIKSESKSTTRFTIGKVQGFYRVRKFKSRGFGIERGKCFNQLHLGRLTIALERKAKIRNIFQFAINAK